MAATLHPPAAAPLVGALGDFPVDQVLRLIGGAGRAGTFTVTGAMPLVLDVDAGTAGPADADVARDDVVQVLFHLALLGEGDFAFAPGPPAAGVGCWSLDALLDDVADRVSRWRLISGVLPSLDVVVRLCPVEAGEGPLELSGSAWNVAVALDGTRRVRDVALLLGGDAFATMESVHGLVTRGLAAVVAADPPV